MLKLIRGPGKLRQRFDDVEVKMRVPAVLQTR